MSETRVAKLFMSGASQAVRLPAAFRFEGSKVYATRDESGDVVLSARPGRGRRGSFRADGNDRRAGGFLGGAADECAAGEARVVRARGLSAALHMLDTDTASFVVKGRSATVEARLAAVPPDWVCVSALTRAELMYGLKRLDASHRLQVGVRQFLKIVRVLAWDPEAADFCAEIRHRLTSAGQLIGELDMMIAAHALAAGAVLVTNNVRHFGRVAGALAVVSWV